MVVIKIQLIRDIKLLLKNHTGSQQKDQKRGEESSPECRVFCA